MSQSVRDPYDVLGIAANATTEEIKQSFRRNAALYHPDESRREAFDQKRQKQLLEDPDAVARAIWRTYLGGIQA